MVEEVVHKTSYWQKALNQNQENFRNQLKKDKQDNRKTGQETWIGTLQKRIPEVSINKSKGAQLLWLKHKLKPL